MVDGAPLRKAVFLDRDGVINRAWIKNGRPFPPPSPADFSLLPGVAAAVRRLHAAGYLIVVCTNQPDVATGRQSREAVEAMHAKLRSWLPVDDIRVCYHIDEHDCTCRKPRPGMLTGAAAALGIDLGRSYMVGDRWRDIEAGQAAGCFPILIESDYSECRPDPPFIRVSSLAEAAAFIINRDTHNESSAMPSVHGLRVKIFADGADLASIERLYADPIIKGFTTNPTLMRKAGVSDYEAFARKVLTIVPDRPVSFEVFADDHGEMETQAKHIQSWGPNVFVKIPVTNTRGESSAPLVRRLAAEGVQVNVTALFTLDQVREITDALHPEIAANISVFAGRIADSGRDPMPIMAEAVEIMKARPKAELIWASPRELLNVFQADAVNCHIITATPDILKKLELVGKDLDQFSLDTVAMFYRDAQAAGYSIDIGRCAAE
ncbi:MAG: transaldolase [Alphaproteobacteria bacterium]|nr:MAG: transaldolase [Alphaproteobacteria bacterium]